MNNQKKIVEKQIERIREQSRRKRVVEKQAPMMLLGLGIILMLLFAIGLIIK
tara:strand:+ start:159 stop:314 length:156 start_codon:yes stop_codon:yes gene_type:complete